VPNINVRDVPEDVHAVLSARAAAARQSLQEYMLDQLIRHARRATMHEVLEQVKARKAATTSSVSDAMILDALDAGRNR
jgi:plasmid stability protein